MSNQSRHHGTSPTTTWPAHALHTLWRPLPPWHLHRWREEAVYQGTAQSQQHYHSNCMTTLLQHWHAGTICHMPMPALIVGCIVNKLKDEAQLYCKMVMETVKFCLLQIRWLGITIPNTGGCLVPVHLNVDCYRTINNLQSHSRFQPRAKVWDREERGVCSSCAQVRWSLLRSID